MSGRTHEGDNGVERPVWLGGAHTRGKSRREARRWQEREVEREGEKKLQVEASRGYSPMRRPQRSRCRPMRMEKKVLRMADNAPPGKVENQAEEVARQSCTLTESIYLDSMLI